MRKMEGALYKIIKVVYYLHCKRKKLKPGSFLGLLGEQTVPTGDKIFLRSEKIEVPPSHFLRKMLQICGVSGANPYLLRCFFDPWIRDGKKPDLDSGIQNKHRGSYFREFSIFWV
jgi:hypothetical protein